MSMLSTHISFGKGYCIEVDLTKRVATFVVLMLKAHSQVPMRSRLGSKQSWKSRESKIKISKNKSKRRKRGWETSNPEYMRGNVKCDFHSKYK